MDHNNRICSNQNRIPVGKDADIFGLSWMSGGAKIYHMPLLDNLVMCDDVTPTVVDIHDLADHMAAGVGKMPNIWLGSWKRRFSNLIRNACIPMFYIFMEHPMFKRMV